MKTKSNNKGIDPERLNNIGAESDEIINNLKNDPKYCQRFFYGGKKEKCIIDSMRSKMLYDLLKDYNVIMAPDTFSTIVYLTLWANGSWAPLATYEKRCTFFAWLKRVAKNAVMERLIEEHEIPDVRSHTVGNTRLTLLSQPQDKCKMIIDDLMVGSKYHSLLTAIYVDRLSEDKIMKRLHIKNVADFEEAKKKGEYKLKDALLRSASYYVEDVLHEKSKHVVTVSSEFVADLSEWCKAKSGVNPLSDVFGTNLTDEEVCQKTVDFLYDFSEKLWPEKVGNPNETDEKIIKKNKEKAENNKRDRLIWCERFIKNTPPVEVADKVNHDRGWLDTRYSRLKEKFEKAIKQWWNSHAA